MSRSQSGEKYQITLTRFEDSHIWSRSRFGATSPSVFQEGKMISEGPIIYAVF